MVEAGTLIFLGIIVFGTIYAVVAAIYYYLKFTFCPKISTLPVVTPEVQTDVEGSFESLKAKIIGLNNVFFQIQTQSNHNSAGTPITGLIIRLT